MSGQTDILKFTIPDENDTIWDSPTTFADGMADVEKALVLPMGALAASASYDSWPLGASTMGLSSAQAASGGWPITTAPAIVQTLRRTDGLYVFQQFFSANVQTGPTIWARVVNSTAAWSPWIPVASPATPRAMATGQITLTAPAAGGTVSATVALPATITAAPRVQLTPVTSLPHQVSVGIMNVSASSFTIYMYRDNDQATSIQWQAVQGVDV